VRSGGGGGGGGKGGDLGCCFWYFRGCVFGFGFYWVKMNVLKQYTGYFRTYNVSG